LKKALAERALNAEMDHHLANGEAGNSRNGYGKKTVVTDTARIELDVPRDRQSSFDPHLIAKYQRRFRIEDFSDKYARVRASASVSIGHRGAWYTIRPRGKRVTVGIPGTGFYRTEAFPAARRPLAALMPRSQSFLAVWGWPLLCAAIVAISWWLY